MANSKIKVDLIFSANTQNAQNNIQQLNSLLQSISKNTVIGVDSGSLSKAVQSAQQLQIHLSEAVNVNTGKLDLNKLNTSLKQSGTNLQSLVSNLQGAGVQGQQAFVKLANAIASAEVPMVQINQKLKDFGTTLLNTVKWQIASSMIHGIQRSIEGAISYAKNLNTALNDIRIVTGKSIEDMSKFAQSANKSAKELNSTTTEYAKASLIFYQQGLDGKAVEDRAKVVLKLAQVTGQSAEEISSSMTAVWNNFYDGSKSLEYYADVLTKLGAETASSTDEITQGLEKFAAIADTVGLSYEYAASSLATVVAETRQAPEVVGTAFKTIFARLQGLSLGETLEDGTDLNKYSSALAKVGVQIKDQYGELKDADVILEETAAKWKLLSKDQQVALSQVVGGLRQYSQFIALMDNWNKVELNVDVAEMSEGELTKQQQIWSEGWEAAAKRVEQSKNNLYSKIINDKTIIGLSDIWSSLIDRVGDFIDRLGGVGGAVMFLINIFSKQLFPLIQNSFTRLANNISVLTGQAAKQVKNMQNTIRQEINEMQKSGAISPAISQQLALSDKLIIAKQELAKSSKNMSHAQQLEAERKMQIIEMTAAEIQKSLELQHQMENEIELLKKKATSSKEFKMGVAMQATKTGESSKLSDKQYQKKFGKSREELAEEATKTRAYLTKRELRLHDTRTDTQVKKATQAFISSKDGKKLNDEDRNQKVLKIEQKIRDSQAKRKKQLEEILRIQEQITGEMTEQSLGNTKGNQNGFILANKPENKDDIQTNNWMKNAQSNIAKELNGSIGKVTDDLSKFTGEKEIVADASIANLEKAYQIQGKYTVAMNKTKAVYNDLTKAHKPLNDKIQELTNKQTGLEKSSRKFQKIEGQKKATMQEAIKVYTDSRKAIEGLGRTAGMSEAEIKDLSNSFEKLNSSDIETVNQGMTEIDTVLQKLDTSLFETSGGIDNLINAFIELMSGKIPDDELEALRSRLEANGVAAAKVASAMDLLGGSMNRNNELPKTFFDKLGNGVTTAMSVVGALQGVWMGIQSLGSAFDENAGPIENFSNYLMGLMGILPAVSMAIKLYTDSSIYNQKRQQMATAMSAGASTWKAFTESFGVPGVIAGAIAAAAVVAAIIGGAFSIGIGMPKGETPGQKREADLSENVEKLTSQLNSAKQAAEDFQESVSDYSDAVTSIDELTKGTQEYYNAIEEANKKARELIETYDLTQQDYTVNAKGIIEIDDKALEKKQEEFNQRVSSTSTQLSLNEADLELTAAENDIKDTEIKYQYEYTSDLAGTKSTATRTILNEEKMAIAKAAAEYGVNEAGLMLTGDDLRDAILEGVKGTDSESLVSSIKYFNDEQMDQVKQFGEALNNATDSIGIFADELITNTSEIKYDNLTTELSDGDTGQKQLLNEFLTNVNNNKIDEDEIVKTAIDKFDKAREVGDLDWDNMSDDDLLYNNKAVKGEFGYMMAAARDIAGDEEFLSTKEDFQALGIDAVLANDLAKNKDISTADLLKATYQAKGYTDIDVKDENGVLKVTAKGNEALGLEDINEELEVSNRDAANQFIDLLQGEAIKQLIESESLSTKDAKKYSKSILEAGENNKYGADFSNMVFASTQNKTFDFSGVFGSLSGSEVKELKKLSPEEIMDLLGIDNEEMLQNIYGDDFTPEKLQEQFRKGLKSWSYDDYKAQAEESGEAEAEALELDVEEFKAYRDAVAATTDAYDDNIEGLNKVVIANQRLDRGVKTIADSWEDINKVMSNSAASAGDLATVLPTVKEGLQDILNLSDEEFELLSPTFAKDNWNLIQDVMNGVEGAVDELRDKAGQDILFQIKGVLDADGNLKEQFAGLNAEIASYDGKQFEVGVKIDDAKFLQTCQNMIDAAGMTAEQAEAYFAAMGYDVEVKQKKITEETVRNMEYPVIDKKTGEATGEKKTLKLVDEKNTYVNAIKSITPTGSYGGGIGVSSTASETSRSGSDGDSSSSNGKADNVKKSDVVERYKRINDLIADNQRAMDKASKSADKLYGKDRLKQMEKVNKFIKEEIKLNKQKRKETAQYLKLDRKDVVKAASGQTVKFDKNGNIVNYKKISENLFNQLNTAIKSANADGEASDKEQKAIDKIQKRIDKWKDAVNQYDETKEQLKDLKEERQDLIDEWKENNYEKLQYKIELKLEFKETELKWIEYRLNKMEDDFYSRAESLALLSGKDDSQLDNAIDKLKVYRNEQTKLDKQYKKGKISQSAYIEGLKEARDGMYDNLEAILDLDRSMKTYYEETLTSAQEEIDKYVEKMESINTVLEHYSTILDLVGKSQDYVAKQSVLDVQEANAKNAVSVSKSSLQMYEEQAQKAKVDYENAVKRGASKETQKRLKEELDAANAQVKQAQDQLLANTETWLESIKNAVENKLKGFAQTLEKELVGDFGTFDSLSTAMSRATSLQEEYLTNTNKIYQTNKLIRTAQTEIDKTSNTVAKQKLKQFQTETSMMQNQNKLSQFELDIQQAKYDLLVAEIALEEAQNAKSTVRLRRDSEGNFGYVYTANSQQIADAQQKYEDAQNALYNKQLEGANNYTDKYQQTLSEFYETLNDLNTRYLNGEFKTREEYNQEVEKAQKYYYDKLIQYGDLYNIAIADDMKVQQEAWSTGFQAIINNSQFLKDIIDKYTSEVNSSFDNYDEKTSKIKADILGADLNSLTEKTQKLANESKNLANELTKNGGVIDSINEEISAVKKKTTAYNNNIKAIKETIKQYEKYINKINETIKSESGLAKNNKKDDKSDNGKSGGNKDKKSIKISTFSGIAPTAYFGNSSTPGDKEDMPEWAQSRTTWRYLGYMKTKNGSIKYLLGNKSGQKTGWFTIKDGYANVNTDSFDGEDAKTNKQVLKDYSEDIKLPDSGQIGWDKKKKIAYYDTGGYTGEWGSDGKLAFLHEKELVLNKTQTQDMLKVMDLTSEIIKQIDKIAGLSQISNLQSQYSKAIDKLYSDSMEQIVTIEANFPNVQDKNEIEEAINDLINNASQFVNRK